MTVHLRSLTLENLLVITRDIEVDEMHLWERMDGLAFGPQAIAMRLYNYQPEGWIIHNGDEPLAAAGFIQLRPGVYRTWMLAREKAWRDYAQGVTALVRDAIATVLAEKLAHRVETITLADRKRAIAWYPQIGLTYEATQRKYGINGEDAVTYVALSAAETN